MEMVLDLELNFFSYISVLTAMPVHATGEPALVLRAGSTNPTGEESLWMFTMNLFHTAAKKKPTNVALSRRTSFCYITTLRLASET